MTLHPQHEFSIPEETARVARAAYPKGNIYMKMRDALGTIYQDEAFAHLFPQNGRPVEAPWRLAFITVVQFMEGLPDRQAADAVRGRIDLKYALGLELTDPGFDFSILSDFRTRLVQGGAEQVLLDAMLNLFKERGWLKERQQQRTDSTHILAKIRAINRLMCVGEAMRFALNSLAVVAGDWLLALSPEEWLYRYGHRIEEAHLPASRAERQTLAELIGRDGAMLLEAIFDPAAPPLLREIPAIEILRQIWLQNYFYEDGQLRWRSNEDIPPPARYISSPYDREARYSKKRSTTWVGYKVHLTETCEKDSPHLITHVATTPAPTADEAMVEPIHEDLEQGHLLPSQHLLDSGYITSQTLAHSQNDYGIEVIGPTRADYKWQASVSKGFDSSHFTIDWEAKQAICASWAYQYQLDAHHRQPEKRDHQDPLLHQRLSSLPQSDALYAFSIQSSSSTALSPSSGAVPSLASSARTSDHTHLHQAICRPLRHRSHHVPRGSCLWYAPFSLYWRSQDPSPTPRHCCCSQSCAHCGLARWG
jgi:transposase